jgi:two-component system LytT family response regulator
MKAIIVDDELPARLVINDLLTKYQNEIEIVAEAETGAEALQLINSFQPDILFLDIQLPDFNGFELLKKMNKQPIVIFTTAYDQYALTAFEENSLDYLVKPIEQSRFDKAIEKIRKFNPNTASINFESLIAAFNKQKEEKVVTALPVKIGPKIILIRFSEIVYCKSDKGYVSIFTKSGKEYISELMLHELENKLPSNFIRVQKSFIINSDMIQEIQRYFNNRFVITLNMPQQVKITTGTSYVETIREKFDI